MLISLVIVARQPIAELKIAFKVTFNFTINNNKNCQHCFQVPLVPLIPCLSVIINVYLMMQLDVYTWIRFVVWLLIG